MTLDELTEFIAGFPGVRVVIAGEDNGAPEAAWGDRFFTYDPDGDAPPTRMPFATIVVHDYEGFDEASDLNREGVFRVNISLSREAFAARMGGPGPGDHDYTAPDALLPHPVYAAQFWVCVLNPGPVTDADVRALLSGSHARAVARHERRHAGGEGTDEAT